MALRCLLQAALVPVLALAGSISSCGAAGDRFSNVTMTLSPDPIQKGDGFTITVTGTLDAPLPSITVAAKLDVKLLGIIDEKVDKTVPIKASPAIAGGPQKLVIGPITLPPHLPGSVDIDGTITITDDAAKQVACVNLAMHVPALASNKLPALASEAVQTQRSLVRSGMGGVENCGQATDHIKITKVSGAGGVDTIEGTLDEDLTTINVDVDMKVAVSIIKIPVQLNFPIQYTPGLKKGPFSISAGPATSSLLTEGEGVKPTVEGTVKIDDGNNQECACISIKSDESTADEEHDEQPSLVV